MQQTPKLYENKALRPIAQPIGARIGFLDNLPFLYKIAIIVFVLFVGTVVIALVNSNGLKNMRNQVDRIYNSVLIPIVSLAEARRNVLVTERNLETLEGAPDSQAAKTKIIAEINTAQKIVQDTLDQYSKEWVTTGNAQFTSTLVSAGAMEKQNTETTTLETLGKINRDVLPKLSNYFSSVNTGKPNRSLKNQIFTQLNQMTDQLSVMINLNKDFASISEQDATLSYNSTSLINLLLTALTVLLGLMLALTVATSTRQRLARLENAANTLRSGNFGVRVNVVGQDEIGNVASAFNVSLGQLQELQVERELELQKAVKLQENVSDFLQVAMDISGGDLTKKGRVTEDALGNVVDAINLMTEEIGYLLKDVQSVSSEVNLGASNLSQVSTGIALEAQEQTKISTSAQAQTLEVTTNMRQMSEAAEVAAQTAQEALQAGQAGQKAVADTVAGIQNIRREVQNISRGMKSLANRSLEISEIVETISGIAAQTNLLALNATVEASSAGEAGARFATVADEVRKLSEEAERATNRVTSLVRAIQTETQAAVVGVEAGAKEVELGFEIASGAGVRLQEISVLTAQSASFAQTIASSTRSQLDQMGNVAKAVQSMAGTASQTEQESKQGQDSAQALLQLSERLSQSLSRFQLPA
jgi:twitching motility protein PilJ